MININSISLKCSEYSNSNCQGNKFHKKRFQLFEEKIKNLNKPITILDIGGTVRFWVDHGYHKKDVLITIINVIPQESVYSNMRVIAGDACDLSIFKDKVYDVSFSNSLIERLYTRHNQLKMANEALRISKYVFIQTPNRYFPVEPHFKFPFFQFLPGFIQTFLQTNTSLINGRRYNRACAINIVKEIRLLSKKEMREFFPKCNIHSENFLGMDKSFTAHNFPLQ